MVPSHLCIVTLTVGALYVYRDLWPIMTYTLHPADGHEGKLLWAKVVLAAFAGIIEPIFEPYPYIPYDPKVSAPYAMQLSSMADRRDFLDSDGDTKP